VSPAYTGMYTCNAYQMREFQDAIPNFVIFNIHKNANDSGSGSLKVDLSLYAKLIVKDTRVKEVAELKGVTKANEVTKAKEYAKVNEDVHRFDPTVCELPIECNNPDEDPFATGSNPTETTARRVALGQLVYYCSEIFACQYRTHLFSVLLFKASFRLFRWDPAGIIVTDLDKDTTVLWKFLQHFNSSTPAQRGLDPSVRWASSDEEKIHREHLDKYVGNELGLNSAQAGAFQNHHHQEKRVAVMTVGETSVRIN
jgi:hypothetical protein